MAAITPQLEVIMIFILFVVSVVFLVILLKSRKRDFELKKTPPEIKEPFVMPQRSAEMMPPRPPQAHAIFVDLSPKSADVVELAVEIWRIQNRLSKASAELPDAQKRGLESSIQKLQKYLDTFRIEIVDHTNQKYNEGLNVNVLSFEIDPTIAAPLIKETIEPTITCDGKVVRKGKVVVIKNN